jgi:hypothetical protein
MASGAYQSDDRSGSSLLKDSPLERWRTDFIGDTMNNTGDTGIAQGTFIDILHHPSASVLGGLAQTYWLSGLVNKLHAVHDPAASPGLRCIRGDWRLIEGGKGEGDGGLESPYTNLLRFNLFSLFSPI